MFDFLGRTVSRYWYLCIAGWLVLLGASYYFAPPWDEVAQDQEFVFLPSDVSSRRGEEMFQKAFPDERQNSNIVLVMHRADNVSADPEQDKKFIEDVLEPGLRNIAKVEGGIVSEADTSETDPFAEAPPPPKREKSIIARIRTPNAPGVGALLVSPDSKALLVVVELTTDFLSKRNWQTIGQVEQLVQQLRARGQLPAGTDIAVTGSAVIGRDHVLAELRAARDTGLLTVILVVVLLVVIYRAPFLALIPLASVFVSVQLGINILAMLAKAGVMNVFQGIQIYLTILAYGAGVDYCLFLTARYREELEAGHDSGCEAVCSSLRSVGPALAASAGTVICGIGMMVFADFGKFRDAGIAIPLGLCLVLLATLTLTPSLFRLAGGWAFWPHRLRHAGDGLPLESSTIQRSWAWVEELISRRPGVIWLSTVAIMTLFAVAALVLHNHISYDMVGDLPPDTPSVVGTRILSQHMPAGMVGPVNLLIVDPNIDFRKPEGRALVDQVTNRLRERKEQLGLADIRSLSAPLGLQARPNPGNSASKAPLSARAEAIDRAARDYYTSDLGGRAKVGTRMDLILQDGPFTPEGIANLGRIEAAVQEMLSAHGSAQLYVVGQTASVRDLQTVIQGDRFRIQVLVLLSVFVILVILLRQLVVPIYLLLSVLFSYFATLGVTFALFWALDPHGFSGIDWKVVIFLFTILIAVGEDYNIFLMSRIKEETKRHGPLRGITVALTRTGPIISSCGIIMAGTFASLLVGKLSEMKQMGFALAFGVLLDTFVVRPILVPAFLLVLRRRGLPPENETPTTSPVVTQRPGSPWAGTRGS